MDTADARDVEETERGAIYIYGVGFFLGFFLLITFWYVSYICKRYRRTRSPPATTISFVTTNHDANHHQHVISISRGLDDDILVTFPTFAYSEDMMPHTDADTSSCSICLADYKTANVIRLLPECGHLFHVKCIDTWLKIHPSCPVCRKSPVPDMVLIS